MKSPVEERKMIWAVDPFEDQIQSRSELIETLKTISKEQNVKIEPLYVLNISFDKENLNQDIKTQLTQYKSAAEKAMKQFLEDLKDLSLLNPRVLVVEDSSLKETVQTLMDYALTTHALSVLVGTHARKGLTRFFLGSFAETMLLHSKLPVITIGPACVSRSTSDQANQILFPTNFDQYSHFLFKRIVRFAKSLHSEVTLMHVIPHEIEPLVQSSVFLLSGGWVSKADLATDLELKKRKIAEEWTLEAQEKGVKVNTYFESTHGKISDLILNQAKVRNVSWIAMGAESGVISTSVLGSINREIVRHSSCPVWVIRVKKDSQH